MFLIIYVAIFSGTTSSKDKYPKVNFWEFLEQELYKVNATNSNQYQIWKCCKILWETCD